MNPRATRPSFFTRHRFALVCGVMLLALFLVYERYNQRYVGAVDWYGYYQEGLLLKSGRATLPMDLPVDQFPAAVPLGFTGTPEGRAVPQYPPGFPLLIAIAAVFDAEFYLMPLIGVASCVFFFLLVRDLTRDPVTAALYAVLWAFCPIVVYMSTNLMSDLVAALFVLVSYWLYRRGRSAWAGGALAFALAVRPTNALYLVVFGFVLWRDRQLIRFGLGMLVPGLLYGWYNHALFGAPWRTGYFDIRADLRTSVFLPHLGFYLTQVFLQSGPPVVLLCGWGFRQRRSENFFYVAWFLAFLLFYCCWFSGGDSWWWTRFLLPAFVPVFLLSALGFSRLRWLIAEKLSGTRRLAARVGLYGLIALTPLYYIQFGVYQQDLWTRNKGRIYYRVARELDAFLPPGTYVGSIEFTGALRIYSRLHPFSSFHANTPQLIDHLLATGHDTYVLVEPPNKDMASLVMIMARYSPEKVRVLNVWGGLPLYRLHAPAKP